MKSPHADVAQFPATLGENHLRSKLGMLEKLKKGDIFFRILSPQQESQQSHSIRYYSVSLSFTA